MDAELVLRTKVCTKCGQEKPLEEFCKNRSKRDGHNNWCRNCMVIYHASHYRANVAQINNRQTAYYKTAKGFTTALWKCLNDRTINGKHPKWGNKPHRWYLSSGVELRLTREQLHNFIIANWETIETIRAAGEVPSIDRIGPSIHYEVGNIRIIPLSENDRKPGMKTRNLTHSRRAKLAMER